LNLQPLAPEPKGDASQVVYTSEVTSPESAVCTPVCTNSAIESLADPLADFVASLTAEQRRRLATLLTRESEEDAS
jgi:hypothetical protein